MNNIADLLSSIRREKKRSQEYMANELEVSVKTVRSWERGISRPDIDQTIQWFKSLGVNPVPYLIDYVHPEYSVKDAQSEDEVNQALLNLIDNLTLYDKQGILYIFCGGHGSSPSSIIQLMLAHLHNPLIDRIPIASQIVTMYGINEGRNRLINTHCAMPNIPMLIASIYAAKDSVIHESDGYVASK